MKADLLRKSAHLIANLDDIILDLKELEKPTVSNVKVLAPNTLQYKPPVLLYREFLLARKKAVLALLREAGITVDD